ncbi:hypothetical protein GCM10010531_21550 [Blastococcus jejuensis]|uniref:Uncharacterized protein n=1 Tax=Blastococcus jejuensis TaxID=351224 RepID=A0ABP6P6M1_9ACTN
MPIRSPEDVPTGLYPVMPSFDSLRGGRRRTATDVLVPERPRPEQKAPAPAPRPPEYADLLRLGVVVARAVAAAPLRVARWSLRQPGNCARRLLGV